MKRSRQVKEARQALRSLEVEFVWPRATAVKTEYRRRRR